MTTKIFRNKKIVNAEIKTLSDLIDKREKWLRDPNNKNRSTYSAVKLDTLEMQEKKHALIEELNNLED
jgi:hypothetical protein